MKYLLIVTYIIITTNLLAQSSRPGNRSFRPRQSSSKEFSISSNDIKKIKAIKRSNTYVDGYNIEMVHFNGIITQDKFETIEFESSKKSFKIILKGEFEYVHNYWEEVGDYLFFTNINTRMRKIDMDLNKNAISILLKNGQIITSTFSGHTETNNSFSHKYTLKLNGTSLPEINPVEIVEVYIRKF
jgi:hypothetical protein